MTDNDQQRQTTEMCLLALLIRIFHTAIIIIILLLLLFIYIYRCRRQVNVYYGDYKSYLISPAYDSDYKCYVFVNVGFGFTEVPNFRRIPRPSHLYAVPVPPVYWEYKTGINDPRGILTRGRGHNYPIWPRDLADDDFEALPDSSTIQLDSMNGVYINNNNTFFPHFIYIYIYIHMLFPFQILTQPRTRRMFRPMRMMR